MDYKDVIENRKYLDIIKKEQLKEDNKKIIDGFRNNNEIVSVINKDYLSEIKIVLDKVDFEIKKRQ